MRRTRAAAIDLADEGTTAQVDALRSRPDASRPAHRIRRWTRIPPRRERLHHEAITAAIALCIMLALQLGNIGAASLPAPLQTHEERLQHG